MPRFYRLFLIFLFVYLSLLSTIKAQSNGNINGIVVDNSGAVVIGASVTVTNTQGEKKKRKQTISVNLN